MLQVVVERIKSARSTGRANRSIAAACVAAGVAPAPLEIGAERTKAPALERPLEPQILAESESAPPQYEPEVSPPTDPVTDQNRSGREPAAEPNSAETPTAAGAVEYVPPTEPEPAPTPPPAPPEPSASSAEAGSPAGEFGP